MAKGVGARWRLRPCATATFTENIMSCGLGVQSG